MKRFLLGFISGVFCFLLSSDLISCIDDHIESKYCSTREECWGPQKGHEKYVNDYPLLNKLSVYFITPGLGLRWPLTDRCRTDESIQYFKCTDLQIYINKLVYGAERE